MKQDDERFDGVALRIVTYLQVHPKAADTLEGVMEWWLKMSPYDASKQDVDKALGQLKDKGVIQSRILADGQEIYSLNTNNKEQLGDR